MPARFVAIHRFVIAALVLSGCAGEVTGPPPPPPPPPPVVASVDISPDAGGVFVGATLTLIAIPRDEQGAPLPLTTVTWTSDAPQVATVSATGTVTGLEEGTAIVSATVAGKQGSAQITVTRPVGPVIVDRVDLDVTTLELGENDVTAIVATPRNPAGQPIPGLGMIWSSSHPDIVMVEWGEGRVRAMRPGSAVITVRVHGKEASATVRVTSTATHDLVFGAWSGVAGQPPVLAMVDPRDSLRTVTAMPPGEVYGARAAPSPDGTKIAFARLMWWGSYRIHVLDRATGTVSVLGESGIPIDHGQEDSPAWSPDGAYIAFRRAHPDEGGRIWVMRPDGSDRRQVTEDDAGAKHFHPTWSPEGNWIGYSRESAGASHIWSVRLDGTGARQHTSGEVYDHQPAWSPNGEWIAFVRAGLVSHIHRVHVATGTTGLLVSLPMHKFAPAWEPDGNQVAFLAPAAGSDGYEVYTMYVGPGPLRYAQRTADGTAKSFPAWIRR